MDASTTEGPQPPPLRWALGLAACLLLTLAAAVILRRARGPLLPLPSAIAITNDGKPKFGPLVCDGSRLYFTELRGNQLVVAQVSVAGGETVAFSTPFPNSVVENIVPDHSGLLIRAWAPFSTRALWRLPLPTGQLRQLPFTADTVAWAPDGKQVAYIRGTEVILAAADGGSVRTLGNIPRSRLEWLRWSPDGTRLRLSATSEPRNESALWEIVVHQGTLRQLPPARQGNGECCGNWSPDGKFTPAKGPPHG